jgi:hypothetical protein
VRLTRDMAVWPHHSLDTAVVILIGLGRPLEEPLVEPLAVVRRRPIDHAGRTAMPPARATMDP